MSAGRCSEETARCAMSAFEPRHDVGPDDNDVRAPGPPLPQRLDRRLVRGLVVHEERGRRRSVTRSHAHVGARAAYSVEPCVQVELVVLADARAVRRLVSWSSMEDAERRPSAKSRRAASHSRWPSRSRRSRSPSLLRSVQSRPLTTAPQQVCSPVPPSCRISAPQFDRRASRIRGTVKRHLGLHDRPRLGPGGPGAPNRMAARIAWQAAVR